MDVGKGNLQITTKDVSAPGAKGALTPFGLRFESLAIGSGEHRETGVAGKGWFLPNGPDTKIVENDNGVVYAIDGEGVYGRFDPASGGGYTRATAYPRTLRKTGSDYWEMKDLPSGTMWVFRPDGKLSSVRDRDQATIKLNYDSQARVVRADLAGGNTVSYGYTPEGKLASITANNESGPAAGKVTYSYSDAGQLSKISRANGSGSRDTSFTYTAGGDLASITAGDAKTRFTYDDGHRVTSVSQGKDGDMATTRIQYKSDTETLVADPDTDQSKSVSDVPRTTYTLNSGDRVTKVTDPLGHSQERTYANSHNVSSQTNGVGGKDSVDWSANDGVSPKSATTAAGSKQSFTYATSGPSQYSPSSASDGQGNSSTMTYSGTGNAASTSNGANNKSSVDYNDNGTLKSSTDPNDKVTKYTIAEKGQYISKITPPEGSKIGATTIEGAPITSVTNGSGEKTSYSYDGQYNVTKVSGGDNAVAYAYDEYGRVTTRSDKNQKISYTYDARGNMTGIKADPVAGGQAPPASTVTYAYNKSGDMTKRTVGGKSASYTYDAKHQLKSMTESNGAVTRFAYDSGGHRTDTWWRTNSDNTEWAAHTKNYFGKSGRMYRTYTATNSSDGAANRVFDLSYCFSKYQAGTACNNDSSASNTDLVQYITDHTAAGTVVKLGYDKSNRLVTADGWGKQKYEYTYDKTGNRKQTKIDGKVTQTLSFNSDNQIASEGYGYDKTGRRTSDPQGGSTEWNALNQATKQTKGTDSATSSYGGEGQDELLQQKSASGTNNYVYGAKNQAGIPRIESQSLSAINANTVVNNDAAGQPISFEDTTGGSAGQFVIYDGLGRLRGTLDSTGKRMSNYNLDPYGAPFVDGGSAKKAPDGIEKATRAAAAQQSPWTTFGIPGAVSGWWKRGARWHDTATATWTSTDPLTTLNDPRRANAYTYAGADPINQMDPAGRDWDGFKKGLACAGGVLGVVAGTVALGASIVTLPPTFGGSLIIAGLALGTIGAGLGAAAVCLP